MKKNSLFRNTFCGVLAFAAAMITNTLAQSVDIAAMTWTQRSDWINIKTDSAVSPHAVGDGVVDDTSALQAALTLASANGSMRRTVYLPPGTYKITQTIGWSGTKGMTGMWLVGCGSNTTIRWGSTTPATMFNVGPGANRSRYTGIRWDGNNVATNCYDHKPLVVGEHPLRHDNEAFLNFTGVAINGDNGAACWAGDAHIWNCLFYNCAKGMEIGPLSYNEYQWEMQYCHFENCGTAISMPKGKAMAYDCHFANSSVADFDLGSTMRIRRCTSVGSKKFALLGGGGNGTSSFSVIQDCWIDSWTNIASGAESGAIQIPDRGMVMIYDTKFTNPPNSNPPINLRNGSTYPCNLIVSGNYCPTLTTLIGSTYNSPRNVITVPPGNVASGITSLSSPQQVFLDSSPLVDSSNILDVTLPPYNANKNFGADATTAIQQAITDAKNANNGSIVYLPCGYYKVSGTLQVTGSNYTIQGSGFNSQVLWAGANGGTMMSVTTPSNISIEHFMLKPSENTRDTAALTETSTGTSSIFIDDITHFYYPLSNYLASSINGDGPGLVLSNLPAGSFTEIGFYDGPFTVHDCGPAEIYGNYFLGGKVLVDGATKPKTGFLGWIYAGIYGCDYRDHTGYDVTVKDNQDLIFGDYYNEQTYNNLDLEGNSATWSGRVTLQGYKQHDWENNTAVTVNNYKGRLFYGPLWALNSTNSNPNDPANFAPSKITHTGTNAVDMILTDMLFWAASPTITTDSGCNLIFANCAWSSTDGSIVTYLANQPNPLTSANLISMAQGFDHLRQLGWEDLKLHMGINNCVNNPSAELDAVNPNPTTTLGYCPSGWTVSGTAVGNGVRNLTTAAGASPFGSGSQSMLVVDSTGTNTGYRLDVSQAATTALSANQGAVFTFDFRLNASGTSNDIWVRAWAQDVSIPACFLYISSNTTSGRLGANTSGGTNQFLSNLTIGTWYRVQVALGSPSSGPAAATVYLTPWTGSGPGVTTSYTVKGSNKVQTVGFNRVTLVTGSPGPNSNINLDNVTLISCDPLLYPAGQNLALESWKQRHFGTAANSGVSADSTDVSGDGMSNLLKYALDADPFAPEIQKAPVIGILDSYLTLTYRRPYSAIGVACHVEGSSDMVKWKSVDMANNIVKTGTDMDGTPLVCVRDDLPITNNLHRFLRLTVVAL